MLRRFLLLSLVLGTAPLAAAEPVDFHKQVLPILANSCLKCHGNGQRKGGFSIDTRESVLKGGESGAAVIPGNSAKSYLVELLTSDDDDVRMPAQGPRLTTAQLTVMRNWIDGGLPWEKGFSFTKLPAAPLNPRRPELPPATSPVQNPIDRLLSTYYQKQNTSANPPADDRTFIRRVYLDLIGVLPTPTEVQAFVDDRAPNKREQLVDRVLAMNNRYAEHWLTFWNDALRNAYRGTGFIDGGRLQISTWLYESLRDNKPYDQFVRELISPVAGSEGFVKGIVWRGVVNASQVPPVQAAQNVSQVFLGINLKCASCHDSFVNDWKLTDAYALANIFADKPLEIHRCDKPTGTMASTGFLYPELGQVDGNLKRPERLAQLATVLTHKENGRLSRTMVNRLWAWLLGRGLVEPVDDLDQPSWHADLLDYLAADFQDHGYDLKRTIRLICTSQAYGAAASPAPRAEDKEFTFHGPIVKRMTAEQLVDTIAQVTGVWPNKAAFTPSGVALDPAPKSPGEIGIRAALVNDDTLTRALGRPNREQVVTRRETIANTLQGIELTNGATLDNLLKKSAAGWLKRSSQSPAELVAGIYRQALSRSPSDAETTAALELLGAPPAAQGVEDLLWSLIMLPEFQLIH